MDLKNIPKKIYEMAGSAEAFRFGARFLLRIGQVRGQGPPLEIVSAHAPCAVEPERLAAFGCQATDRLILVACIPAGTVIERGEKADDRLPLYKLIMKGVDPKEVPPKDEWLDFPDKFEGITVVYVEVDEYPFVELDTSQVDTDCDEGG